MTKVTELAARIGLEKLRNPHSAEAEQAVLGSLMLDPSIWASVELGREDFFRADHKVIFGAIAELADAGKPHDALVVCELLERRAALAEAGGRPYVLRLQRDTGSATNIQAYADIVRDRANLRRLAEVGFDISRKSMGTELGVGELLKEADAALQSISARLPQSARRSSLAVRAVSEWATEAAPAPRDWIIEDLLPAGRVTSLLGNGGLGKTTIAAQLSVHIAANIPLYGLEVSGGPVLGVYCEDEADELERRIRAACSAEQLDLANLDQLYPLSRDGLDNLLCTFDREQIQLTRFYHELEATIATVKPRLVIIDTAADVFAGDFMSTPHVRQFIKVCLGGLCVRHGCAVLLIAHPSAAGMSSGDGGGFSTAWNNSVRSRLYLRRPKSTDEEATKDRRVLELMKANYGPDRRRIPLVWDRGGFVLDRNPIDEGAGSNPAGRTDTRLALAVGRHFREHAPGGEVVSFGRLFEALQANGDIPKGEYQKVRKPLQRALKALTRDGVLAESQVPRGYRRTGEIS